MMRGPKPTPSADKSEEKEESANGAIVKLSQNKLRSVQLHVTPCQIRELRDLRTVPGKITYNEAQHLEIKAPAGAVVKQVLVTPQQSVKKGDRLAVLSSPEIGLARDAVAQCKSDLVLAQREAGRTEQIATNLVALLDLLKQHPEPAQVEKQFDNRVLGEHRQQIVSTYSKLFMAEAVADNLRALEDSKAVSGRVLQERRSDREVAKAAFATACEQARFEISQDREKSQAAMQHAERMLAVCRQRLESLGGESFDAENASQSELSELLVKAPFDGTVVERIAATAAHVTAGQPLFVLANTDTLWVSAEVHERDWKALDGGEQHELVLHAPSLPDSETPARVKFTEGRISPETHTLTIVGELENRSGQFRPGMFVWVSVPMSQPQRVLTVPVSAIVQHEQIKFVFVADGPDTFHRADVTTGLETPEWVEITEGLQEGQNVVDAGTFALKSELLLEHEAG
jgi:cobalt-zinc-cadmium efflux system membrane fusion protein